MTDEPTPSEMRHMLEKQGAEKTRIQLTTGNLPMTWAPHAISWLAELDAAERARNEASQVSQMRTALSANRAAWIAAIAAIIAAVIAMIGTIVTVLAWVHPLR
jgi:hypothetical protein